MKTHSKILIVSLVVVLFTVPTLFSTNPVTSTTNETPIQKTAISQTGHKVLFDEAHCALGSATYTPGNASLMGWILEEHGYETDMNFDQQLDSGILSGVDILFLVLPMVALTGSEVTAVNNFVQAGGGLILVGIDAGSAFSFTSANLNPLSQTYGITFATSSEDTWLASTDDMITHHLTQDVSSIHSNIAYQHKGTYLTVESPATSVIEHNDNSVVAVSEHGTGKVVCVGALAPFLEYRYGTHWQTEKDDLFQFTLNIADWLVGVSPRKVVVPEQAVITVGSGPSLSPTELDNYKSYNGIIHDHTTHSDGADTPADMLWAGVSKGLDYMVMTDHSYESANPIGLGGITGGLAMKAIAEANDIDIEIFVGAELSRGKHSMAFPLYENIYTDTQEGMIAGAHAQGAMIALCHPTISSAYMETYEQYDSLGYDAIEVTCQGHYNGLWDEGFTRPFYGASDGHSFEYVGTTIDVIFVDQTTGPDGRLSDVDVVDAILNKRIVVIDNHDNIVYGQQVWVDRYFELMEQAETDIANAVGVVDTTNGNKTTLAELYLEKAEDAYAHNSPHRAIYAAANASAAEASDIAIETISPSPRFLYPLETHNFTLNITNDNSDSIQFNISRYFSRALSTNCASKIMAVPSNGYTLLDTNITTGLHGYLAMVFNIKDFNTTSNLGSVIFGVGGLINVGYHSELFETEVGYTGTNVTVAYQIARGDSRFLTSAVGFYDDGSGWQNKSVSIRTVTLEGTVGPYPKDTVITAYMIVYDMFGGEFVLPQTQYTILTDPLDPPTSTPTPTNTGTGPPLEIDPVLLLGIAGGVVVVVIIVIFMKKKQGV